MHQVDKNDLEYVRNLGHNPVGWVPHFIGEDNLYVNRTLFSLADGSFVSVFHVKPVYYETVYGTWRPLSEVCTYHGNKKILLKPNALSVMAPRFLNWLVKRQAVLGSELLFDYGVMGAGVQPKHLAFATTLTAYPDPNPETTTVDGCILHTNNPSAAVWATLRETTSYTVTAFDATGATNGIRSRVQNFNSSNVNSIERAFLLFDTSSIGSGSTLTSATFSLYVTVAAKNTSNATYDTMEVVQVTPASNTALATSDFLNVPLSQEGTFGSLAITSGFTTGAYNDWTLSSIGTIISTTSITKLGLMTGWDYLDSQPSLPSNDNRCAVFGYDADYTGTGNDPKLVVVYTAGGGGFAYSQAVIIA